MLKKQNRLSSKFEYNVTRKYGKKLSGQLFHLFFLEAKGYDGASKIGIVVSNKFHKSAVKRNRIKRLFREAIKPYLTGRKIPKGFWIVIHPKFNSVDKTYEEISTDVNKVLQNISFS